MAIIAAKTLLERMVQGEELMAQALEAKRRYDAAKGELAVKESNSFVNRKRHCLKLSRHIIGVPLAIRARFFTEIILRWLGRNSVPQLKIPPLQRKGLSPSSLGDLRNDYLSILLFLKENYVDLKTVDGQLS